MIVIIVGDYGTGKTTELKQRFLSKTKKKKRVYAPVADDFLDLKLKVETEDFEKYMADAVKLNDTFFAIDESVTVIPLKQPDANSGQHEQNILLWLVNARKFNNCIFFLYHDFTETPLWIFKKADYLLRYRTNDQYNVQINRFRTFPNVVRSFTQNNIIENFVYDEIKVR